MATVNSHLLATKLRPPAIPPQRTLRPRLVRRLNNGLEAGRQSTLLSAPASFGKHVIQDRFILQVLQTLVGNLPPALHLVLLTREDPDLPLARLRARNQLTEIRAGDLCFTRPEIADFLSQVMGLSLSQFDIASLADKTEGWIAGLQLAGLSIRDRVDPSGFIAGLRGTHRFSLSYLTEEVLHRRPPEIQNFLLQTSILERLNGALCDAVTGRAESVQLLELLLTANLFLIPLDDEGRRYRYHPLFADLLRDRQLARPGRETIDLHRRTSRWYAQAGMASAASDPIGRVCRMISSCPHPS